MNNGKSFVSQKNHFSLITFFFFKHNPCSRSPCLNNSTCQAGFTSKGFRCVCRAGFTGTNCTEGIRY